MSTTMAKPGMERKWYIIDAAGKPLGRTAEKAAVMSLQGVKQRGDPRLSSPLFFRIACTRLPRPLAGEMGRKFGQKSREINDNHAMRGVR